MQTPDHPKKTKLTINSPSNKIETIQEEEEIDEDNNSSEDKEEEINLTEEENSNPILIQCLKNLAFFSRKVENLDNEKKQQVLIDLKGRAKLLAEENSELLKYIQRDEIILNMRDLLIDRDKIVRQNCVTFFKIIMNGNCIKMFRRHKIYILICRNIEKSYNQSNPNSSLNEAVECKKQPSMVLEARQIFEKIFFNWFSRREVYKQMAGCGSR